VKGGVQGFAANVVASQSPAPGTRVLDNGAPTIVLTLARNGKYGQKGTPEDAAPYGGTPVQLADLASTKTALSAPSTPAAKPAKTKHAKAKPTAKPKAAAKPKVVAGPKPAAAKKTV